MIADDFEGIAAGRKRLAGAPEPWQAPSKLRPCAKCGADDLAKCTCDNPRCPCGYMPAGQCDCCGC
ncbi:MAG TPA: hypothetical protein VMS01_04255 [Stellaceae bacterium]|nr:hypothetical protein [Stellaceae bacterium]